VGEDGEKTYKRLPPSSGLENRMKDFMNEVSAQKGSIRSKNAKQHTAFEVGKMPPRPKVKMQYYDIAECPWQTKAPPSQKALLKSNLYVQEHIPSVRINSERMEQWETMGRECISMLSHLDHFVAANAKLSRTMFQKMEDGEKMTEEEIWNFGRMGVCMSYSAGMAIQDIAKNVIWQVGEENVTRRDMFLERMKDRIPDHEILKLRAENVNGPDLIDEEMRVAADKLAESRKKDKLQSTMIHKALSLKEDRSSSTSNKRSDRSDKGKYPKYSFQRYDKDEKSEQKDYDQKQSDYKPNYSQRGRGGNSRGQRGGQRGGRAGGRFTRKKFGQY
jgi:hypothetical protein